MSLIPAIQFNDLAAQLTVEETKQFIGDLAVSHPQLIIQLLSTRFIRQSTVRNNEALNAHCNGLISAIIQSRVGDRGKSGVNAFHELPRMLIGHCGSFLDQRSYKALSLCNRATYLGTNSPIMLKELDVRYPFSVDLASFPMASKLTLRISKFRRSSKGKKVTTPRPRLVKKVRIIASGIAKMPRLQSLDLNALGSDHELIEIIANHERTNQNVRCVSLHCDTVSSLKAFKSLEFLHLAIGQEDADATVPEMKEITRTLRGLKGLILNDCNSELGLQLLQSIGHQLQYLELHHIDYDSGNLYVLENTNFGNLKQFVIGETCEYDSCRDILETATNLEKVKIQFRDGLDDDGLLSFTEMIEIVDVGFIIHLLDAMNRGLFRSRMCERESLRIRIENFEALENEEEDLVMRFDQTIHQLQMSKVEQWVILLGRCTTNQIKTLIDSLQTANVRIVEDKESELVVISNLDCIINGYAERWLMS